LIPTIGDNTRFVVVRCEFRSVSSDRASQGIVEPLAAEWDVAKTEIVSLVEKAQKLEADAKQKGGRLASAALGQATIALKEAQSVLDRYLKRLADFRILDPACGSGNFLYIALRELKDLEHRAQVEAEALGLPRRFPSIGPEVVKGIEINPYAPLSFGARDYQNDT
jgi:hypothetical protein